MELSIMQLFTLMGPLALGIVAILALMSLVSVTTATERLLAIRAAARDADRALPGWRAVLAADVAPEVRREAYDRAVRSTLLNAGVSLRRGLAVLAGIGSTAPFVGLVGTVLGIVNAFQQLATSEKGGVDQVSAGIAEALVTTALGIAVAIPAVWLFNYLSQRVARLLAELESRAQDLAVATLTER